jgi:3-oxoadipate enol-lactonase
VPRATVNGVDLQYELIGNGDETLVFLNGIAMSIAHWSPIVPPLADRWRCLCHDFRGQLLSPRKAAGAGIAAGRAAPCTAAVAGAAGTAAPGTAAVPILLADHVEDLRILMDDLGLRRAHLIGTSYGAEVAMMFALAFPERTASLIVIDGVSELDPLLRAAAEGWKAAALADPIAFYRTIIPWNYSSAWIGANADALKRREAGMAALPRAYFEDFAALCDAFLGLDITGRLHEIGCPTLVMVGEKDILKHAGFARIIAGTVAGACLKVIAGAGHAAVIESPAEVLAGIEGFLLGGGR